MTVEQLLKPRYKVIADYPLSPYKVGDLMKQNGSTSFFITSHKAYVDGTPIDVEDNVFEATLAKYPHLFRKLEWWEERKPGEMPEYVKENIENIVGKVIRVIPKRGICIDFKDNLYEWTCLSPATETEYNEYLKTLTP